jgi:hypothetical protein
MDLEIEYCKKDCFSSLEHVWRQLERGNDMTIFQSYDWNKMIVDHCLPPDTYYYETVFVTVRNHEMPLLIAPLWIIKHSFRFINKKGVYLVGKDGWSDYLNCIYDIFDPSAFYLLFKDVSRKYHVDIFVFDQVRETTQLYNYIRNKCVMVNDQENVCVRLDLPHKSDDYMNILSKNTKQNLRTAKNRLLKDKKELICIFDDQKVDKKRCWEIRQNKLQLKYSKVSPLRKFKYRMMSKFRFSFPSCIPLFDNGNTKIMAGYIDGELSAFFNYLIDVSKKEVVVIAAGTNLKYARYSPGMLLMYNFINEKLQKGDVVSVDFTRGDEMYKIALGGVLNNNRIITFTL